MSNPIPDQLSFIVNTGPLTGQTITFKSIKHTEENGEISLDYEYEFEKEVETEDGFDFDGYLNKLLSQFFQE